MKIFILTLFVLLSFNACGGASNDTTQNGVSNSTTPNGVALVLNKSVSCTTKTHFSVTPTGDPTVIFSKNTTTGITSVTLTSTTGSAILNDCTQP